MIRLFLLFIIMLAAASFVGVLVANPGHVSMRFGDWQVDTSFAFLVIATILTFLALWFIGWLVHTIFSIPSRLRSRRLQKHYVNSIDAITSSLTALAAGNTTGARVSVKRIQKYLGGVPITHLLTAQILKQEGKEEEIKDALQAMLAHPETRVLAAQNLAEYAAKQGKLEQAWGYIQETTDSGDTQSLRTLLSIAAKSGKWVEADSSLASYRASGLISRSEYRRLHGLLKLLQAEELLKRGDSASALPLSAHAFKLLPDFTPSGAVYAQVLLAQKQSDHAFKILKKAWKYGPHPMLAEVFRELTAGETPEQGFKHAKKIAALSPEDKESRLLLAEAAVRSKHWYVARVELNALLAVDVSARACKLMADVEQGEYNDYDASSSWRIKAGEAPREATWVCRECGNVGDIYWHVHCGHCNAFDSLLWLMPRTTGTDVAI